ncbi:hypothetical protein Ahy_B02g057769 [Arachis hypogaea]|uniref:Uncharacterized protein n=1 Tax=Arachis hypogaea TaxID=3818 RepID=A0A445AD37_ARAHY|nr:hypothetical protein Ahy_B02g057769 [Arachis hypogaea]
MADTNPFCKPNDEIISNLPDFILCHIFSFLPISISVRTCILECNSGPVKPAPEPKLEPAAIGSHLKELRLKVWSDKIEFRYVVPPGVFSCRASVNLNVLGVTLELTPEASSLIHLPSLKTLHLFLDSADNVDFILSGCPLLETMHFTI